jgi:transposase
LLKNLGLVIGRATFNAVALRAEALIANRAEPSVAVEPLIKARKVIEEEIGNLDRKVMKLARHDRQMRGLMTAPWIGPFTALCFRAIIDDPTRFKRARSVGAYVGLTTRRLQVRSTGTAASRNAVTPCCAAIPSRSLACS